MEEQPEQNISLVNLENFNPSGDRSRVINSPRSLAACQRVNIAPEDLFLLNEEELAQRLQELNAPEEEKETYMQDYYQDMNEVFQQLIKERNKILRKERRARKRMRRRRRKKKIKYQGEPIFIDEFMMNQIKDLQRTIDTEVKETAEEMQRRRIEQQILEKEKKRMLMRLQYRERRCGYYGLFDIRSLKRGMKSINSMKSLRKLEKHLISTMKRRIQEERKQRRILIKQDQKQKEKLNLEQRILLMEMIERSKQEDPNAYSRLDVEEKIQHAKESRELQNEIRRERMLLKEYESEKRRQRIKRKKTKKQLKKMRDSNLREQRRELYLAIQAEMNEKKRQELLEKMEKDEFRLYMRELEKQEMNRQKKLYEMSKEEMRRQAKEESEFLEMYRVAQIEAERSKKDERAGIVLMLNEERKRDKVNRIEYKYLEKKERLKQIKDIEEFQRGMQMANIFMDNEKYYFRKEEKKLKDREHQEAKKKIDDKKRQIHDFFKNTRKENLPKSLNQLQFLREAVSDEIEQYLMNFTGMKTSTTRKSKRKISKKKKKKKKSRKKRGFKLSDEQISRYLEELKNENNQEVMRILNEQQEVIGHLEQEMEEEKDENVKNEIMMKIEMVKNEADARIGEIMEIQEQQMQQILENR